MWPHTPQAQTGQPGPLGQEEPWARKSEALINPVTATAKSRWCKGPPQGPLTGATPCSVTPCHVFVCHCLTRGETLPNPRPRCDSSSSDSVPQCQLLLGAWAAPASAACALKQPFQKCPKINTNSCWVKLFAGSVDTWGFLLQPSLPQFDSFVKNAEEKILYFTN